jgi:hypothetical protein
MTTSGTKEQVKQAAGTATEEGRHVAGVAQGEAKNVAGEARTQVKSLMGQATEQVDQQSRQQKDRLAQTMRTLGDDLENMASQSQGGLAANLAREVAERARSLSDTLENREARDLLEEVKSFARRRPGMFLLGSLAAGMVAGRLTRSAREAQSGPGSSGGFDSGSDGGAYGATMTDPTYGRPSSGAVPASTVTSVGPGTGTAAGSPLAGTGTPDPLLDDPVLPGESGAGTTYTDPSTPGGRP